MRLLMTGGTGFIAAALCPLLASQGHTLTLWTRQASPKLPEGVSRATQNLSELKPGDFDAIINLAGAGIADQRWTAERKVELFTSRTQTTRALIDWIASSQTRPSVLLSASAVGYYGEQGDQPIYEETAPAPGFTHDLCQAWETEALKAEALGLRVCLVRTGVVLDASGGALAKMLPAFRFGLGGPLGNGRHWFPWIHRQDIAAIYAWLLTQNTFKGSINACAPNPVTNRDFTAALGATLKRPAFLPMPALVLKLMFGEMAELLLVSSRMLPARLNERGFEFTYPTLKPALEAILRPANPQ